MASVVDDRAKVGAYLRLDRDWSGDGNDVTLRRYVRAGVTELHLYHLGLLTKVSSRAAAKARSCSSRVRPGPSAQCCGSRSLVPGDTFDYSTLQRKILSRLAKTRSSSLARSSTPS